MSKRPVKERTPAGGQSEGHCECPCLLGLIMKRAGKRTERARLHAGSKPIRAAGSRRARSLLASHARPGHLTTSKGTSWARARRATRDFLARPAGGPHAKIGKRRAAKRHKNRARGRLPPRKCWTWVSHVRAIAASNARAMASLAAHMRCAKVGRNDTIPVRRFWCNIHTPLLISTQRT